MFLINLPMPDNCDECPCLFDGYCKVTGYYITDKSPELCAFGVFVSRPNWCPLVEIVVKKNPCQECQEFNCEGCEYKR